VDRAEKVTLITLPYRLLIASLALLAVGIYLHNFLGVLAYILGGAGLFIALFLIFDSADLPERRRRWK
jgi:hypothetical protein